MSDATNARIVVAARVARIAGALVSGGGIIVLLGWWFHVDVIKAPLPGQPTMKANAALGFALVGLALALPRRSSALDRVARLLAWTAAAIGAITAVEWIIGWDAGIDQLIADGGRGLAPGRMATTTAVGLVALGASVAIRAGRSARLVGSPALLAFGLGLLSLVDYGYGIRSLYGLVSHSTMALHTAALFVVASIAALLSRPDIPWVALILSDGLGGSTARRLLPVAIAAPVGIGWILLQGPRLGLYGTALALALVVVSRIGILTVVILGTARSLDRIDLELTARKRREWRMQEASRLKSEFLANMSHELRTPLNAILGFTTFVHQGKAGALTAEQHEFLGDVLKSSGHLLQLVNDILDLAKVESGMIDIEPELVDLGSLVDEVRNVTRGMAADRGLAVRVAVDPSVRSAVVDPARVKQILYNFVSNAIKFSHQGGRVEIRVMPEGSEHFRLDVEDTGIGIAEVDQHRLFVEFQQLDSGAGKRFQGTGLGLALTKRLAEAHGGRVAVHSAIGRGSTFSAILPRTIAAAVRTAAAL